MPPASLSSCTESTIAGTSSIARSRLTRRKQFSVREAHRTATGIEYARAMIAPHEACDALWLGAMASVGFDAAISTRALPFARTDEIGDPLYELWPAETAFGGFPVLNRFSVGSGPAQ